MTKRTATRHLILGTIASGKSHRAKDIVDRTKGPVWVWDPTCEWAGPDADRGIDGAWLVTDFRDGMGRLAGRSAPSHRIVWQVEPERFPAWCKMLTSWRARKTVVVDEAHDFAMPGRCSSEFIELVRKARHAHSDLILIGQRPTGIDPHIRSQMSRLTVFRMNEARDLDWIGGHCGRSVAEKVKSLPPRKAAEWDAFQPSK